MPLRKEELFWGLFLFVEKVPTVIKFEGGKDGTVIKKITLIFLRLPVPTINSTKLFVYKGSI